MAKTNFTVVRNESYPTTQVSIREGHNERKHDNPLNADIEPERAALNVHYHQNFTPDGTLETYQQTIDRLLAEKKIVKYNFKPKSAIIDELVFDVNTAYFEENGGYEFSKKFYEEVYRYAVQEVGSEDYILSAVLHADERNKALSEKLGRDVFHYHLHVVYVPVVTKEIKWTKRAGPDLAGKVKDIIPQINHTDKWPRIKVGRGYINEYSKLQDRYYEHMKAAGFEDFERGVRGSTVEHLDVLDFKIQQDTARAEAMTAAADEKEEEVAALDAKADRKKKQLDKLDEKIVVRKKIAATIDEIDSIGKPALLGGITATADEMKKLKMLAKKGVTADEKVSDMKRRLGVAESERDAAKTQLAAEIQKRPSITDHLHWFDKFMAALKRAPKRLMAVIEDIMRQPPEQKEPERMQPERNKNKSRMEAR